MDTRQCTSSPALAWLEHHGAKGISKCDFRGFVRRALSVFGWRAADVLAWGLHTDSNCIAALQHSLHTWMAAGMPREEGFNWKMVRAGLLARLFPPDGSTSQTRNYCWWTACSLLSVGTFCFACKDAKTRSSLRCMLRSTPPALQEALWCGKTDDAAWSDMAWHLLQCCTADSAHEDHLEYGYVYAVADLASHTWYIGRTKHRRKRHGGRFSGISARFQEHLLATFRAHHQLTEK